MLVASKEDPNLLLWRESGVVSVPMPPPYYLRFSDECEISPQIILIIA